MNSKERIQKIIAEGGEYSRRQVEKLIDEGRVKINGIVVRQKGIKVDPQKDRIQIAGKAFRYRNEEKAYLLFNKPRRVVAVRNDAAGRRTIYDFIPEKLHHLKPVGQLDYYTQGALLLTNDGDMILHLTHPRYPLTKIYQLKITRQPDEKQLRRLQQGIVLDGERTLPLEIKVREKRESSWLVEVRVVETKSRQIRQIFEAVGLIIKEIRRVTIGPVALKSLPSGQFRFLTPKELQRLNLASA